jgi:hypothetical protein
VYVQNVKFPVYCKNVFRLGALGGGQHERHFDGTRSGWVGKFGSQQNFSSDYDSSLDTVLRQEVQQFRVKCFPVKTQLFDIKALQNARAHLGFVHVDNRLGCERFPSLSQWQHPPIAWVKLGDRPNDTHLLMR